jgi:hypothetical protein
MSFQRNPNIIKNKMKVISAEVQNEMKNIEGNFNVKSGIMIPWAAQNIKAHMMLKPK